MPNNHEWQCWHGGICPVDPETEVHYIIRASGKRAMRAKAGHLAWDHGLAETYRRNDIVAYRIVGV